MSQIYSYQDAISDSITIYEHYAIGETSVTSVLGHWTPLEGLKIPRPEICERRSDLHGITLRAVGLTWIPMTRILQNSEILEFEGLSIDILDILKQELNFEVISVCANLFDPFHIL